MEIIKQGQVEIGRIEQLGDLSNGTDVLLWEISGIWNHEIDALFSGDDDLLIKVWPRGQIEKVEPTIINTGLKWKTFNMDDNIVAMSQQRWGGIRMFVCRRRAAEKPTIYMSPRYQEILDRPRADPAPAVEFLKTLEPENTKKRAKRKRKP